MQQRIASYTFDVVARTVTFTGLTVDSAGLISITNLTRGHTLLSGQLPASSIEGSVVTLNDVAPLISAHNTDKLLILYDDGVSPATALSSPPIYGLTPVSPGQYGVACSTVSLVTPAAFLTIPAGATCATVQAVGGTVYYTTDAATAPAIGTGMVLLPGASVFLQGFAVIRAFWPYSDVATLNVEYFE